MASKATAHNISATGNKSAAGFTLIEMMVVLTIMGIALLMCLPLINSHRESYTLERESTRLLEALRIAASDAVLHGDTWGLRVTADSYEFLRFDRDLQQWAAASDPALGDHALPAFLSLSLQANDSLRLLAGGTVPAGLRPDMFLLATGQTSNFILRLKVNSDNRLSTLLIADGHSGVAVRKDDNARQP